jgi:cell division transport system permease protein
MDWRRNLLPDHRASGQFLPWVIAVMVYLAALSASAGLTVNKSLGQWRDDLTRNATVQIVASKPDSVSQQVDAALEALRATPGIEKAEALSQDELVALLEPWLGSGNVSDDLPMPKLIEVTLVPKQTVDFAALRAKLVEVAPDARLDTHDSWIDRLVTLARTVQAIAIGIVILIGLATIAIVVFATRAGLAADQQVIEVLHLIGGQDGFIAGRFQSHFLRLALRGGFVGLGAAAATVVMLARFTSELGGSFVPKVFVTPVEILILLTVPLVAALTTMLTARVTVIRSLSRIT